MNTDCDLLVIGGGPGGMAAARAGARVGARTLLVQDGEIGGDCTFTGCVPSKTLIEAAHAGLDFPAAIERVHRIVGHIAATENADVFRREGIDVRPGRARFVGPRVLEIDGERVRARRVVLATGAAPLAPPIEGLDGVSPLTNETVFGLTRLPRSLAVLGGGPIGCELAQAFARLGAQVTVVDKSARLLSDEEREASAVVADVFRRDGIDVRLGQPVVGAEQVRRRPAGVRLRLAGGDVVEVERVLVAVGRRPVTDGLDPDAGGVALDADGYICTDRHLATTADGVYAVGDVTGRLPFTHAADEMGRVAVANALGRGRRRAFDAGRVPWVTFTTPEVARVGMTESEAAANGGVVAYLPMSEVDRAVTAGRTDGFVKLVAGPRRLLRRAGGGRLLGATVVADRAGELIHEPALAMRTGMFTGRLAQTVHAYPTWSVAIQQAAAQFFFEIGGRRAQPAVADGESLRT